MNNEDIIITTLSKDKKINGYITTCTNTAKSLQNSHQMNMISSAVFCRALAGGILLSGNLKNTNDIITLNWKCTGPAERLFVEANGLGEIRGFIGNNNLSVIDKSLRNNNISSEPYIGFGELVVSRMKNDGGEPYNSITVIETGEIAADLSLFIKQSLQIDSALNIALSIDKNGLIETVGGILFMAMPDADDDDVQKLENAFKKVGSLTDLLKSDVTNEQIINDYFSELEFDVISKRPISFKCSCSDNRIRNILKSLKSEDFTEYISENELIEAHCQFCGKRYSFEPKDLK